MTKAMISTMRTIIKEEQEGEQTQMGNNIEEIKILENGNIVSDKPGMTQYWDEEKTKFLQSITNGVTFKDFIITPKTNTFEGNVILSGKLDGYDANFTMNKDQTAGLRITTNDTQLNDDFMELLKKLKGYYDNWQKEWANKLQTENFK